MRAHAGLAAKRVDLASAVVGERRGSRALKIKARLDKRVLVEGPARFLRHGGYSSLGERYEIQVETSQQQTILSEFRWIGRRDQQPSHRYLVAALSRRFRRRYPRFFRLIRNLERGAFAILLKRQLNQPIDKGGQLESRRLPELRIHADSGEARNRVDLVHVNFFQIAARQKIDARHPTEPARLEHLDRHCTQLLLPRALHVGGK